MKSQFTEEDKVRARHRVLMNVRRGNIAKGPCEVCGTTENVQGHHEDYSFPNMVRWLCFTHHQETHRRRRGVRQPATCKCGAPAGRYMGYCNLHHAEYMRHYRRTHEMSEDQKRKDIARSKVTVYVKRGKIVKAPCVVCGEIEVKARIWNYDDPLHSIEWLCDKHHAESVREFARIGGDIRFRRARPSIIKKAA